MRWRRAKLSHIRPSKLTLAQFAYGFRRSHLIAPSWTQAGELPVKVSPTNPAPLMVGGLAATGAAPWGEIDTERAVPWVEVVVG